MVSSWTMRGREPVPADMDLGLIDIDDGGPLHVGDPTIVR